MFLGFVGLFFASCLQEKDVYNPDRDDQDENKVGLITDFSLKTDKTSVTIHATTIDGRAAEGVKYGIYTSNPYLNEDGRLENPAFVGYTNGDGKPDAIDYTHKVEFYTDYTDKTSYKDCFIVFPYPSNQIINSNGQLKQNIYE